MPGTISVHNDDQDRQDEDTINKILTDPNFQIPVNEGRSDLEPKHADAVDFEDISDTDLAFDEDEIRASSAGGKVQDTQNLYRNGGAEDNELDQDPFEELFGEPPSSPLDETKKQKTSSRIAFDFEGDEILGEPIGQIQEDAPSPLFPHHDSQVSPPHGAEQDFENLTIDEGVSDDLLLQQRLFAQSRALADPSEFLPGTLGSQDDALASFWPKFQKDTVPKFMELLPPKRARFVGKQPVKPPKPVHPTKVKLDIAADQEKHFKLSTGPQKRKHSSLDGNGFIQIIEPQESEVDDDEDDTESDYEREAFFCTWHELQTICADWDIPSPSSEDANSELFGSTERDDLFGDVNDMPMHKRRKLNEITSGVRNILDAPIFETPSFDNYDKLLEKSAQRVVLDPKDPHLLLVEQGHQTVGTKPRYVGSFKDGQTISTKEMLGRYNISNDAAYEKLKQNHQNKVRSTLGNLSITHSMPALRLQFPYYRTTLMKGERRSFHRPIAHFNRGEPITFQIPKFHKRKHMRGKEALELYNKTSDLTLADNANALLLEYSEEAPTTMSNFGMGSRLMNYYRKRHQDDSERPKSDIGELNVLMPNDTSPLTQFGEIKPGETRPAIYNSMFKAPVYQHQPKGSDFLLIRNSNGIEGSRWYIRDVDYIRVVGQQFPSIEVPPPGGRKVTTASKNRLKMVAYRIMKRRKPQRVPIQLVTEHVADSSDMQNRQKMKDFLVFNKESREWEMQGGQPVPDEDTVRTYVSPEDVCLLESMQVGEQRLIDEGFGNEFSEGQNEDEESKEGLSLEQQLAPWQTTKNFLNAAANKAMLQVHGEGDPSGRGEAFSFLKVSMKGGFKALGESVEDKIDAKKRQENGGHNYNVQKQAEQYKSTIRHVWEAQNQSLSSTIEHSDPEPDPDDISEPSRRSISRMDSQPSGLLRRRDDETMSHLSKFSAESQSGKYLRIIRKVLDKSTNMLVDQEVTVDDPNVWKKYIAIKNKIKADSIDIRDIRPGDDRDLARLKLQKELGRLERNRERRHAREKQKGGAPGDSPNSPDSPVPGGGRGGPGTQRKCANCGQVGHIKTNKKLCPLLNGTMKPDDGGFGDTSFSTSIPAQ